MHQCPVFFGRLATAMLIAGLAPVGALAQSTVWGLQNGDTFSVRATIQRTTHVQLEEQPETESTTTDTFTLVYSVNNVLPGGDLAVQVRVRDLKRRENDKADEKSNLRLAQWQTLSTIIRVDPEGVVQQIAGDRKALERLTESRPSGKRWLNEAVSEKVFMSWISQPFWLTVPERKPDKPVQWERLYEISLGQQGILRTVVEFEAGEPGDDFTPVTISGNSRHLPSAVVGGPLQAVQFINVKATVDSFTGTGSAALGMKPDDELESVARRPMFEDLTIEFRSSGQATLKMATSERKIRFRLEQKQSWQLMPGYQMGQGRGFRLLTPSPR